jgi:hypothetical protein
LLWWDGTPDKFNFQESFSRGAFAPPLHTDAMLSIGRFFSM